MRRRRGFRVQAARVHRWLSLLIDAQVLLWFASGLAMTLIPLDGVHGDTRMRRDGQAPLVLAPDLLAPVRLAGASGMAVTEITVRQRRKDRSRRRQCLPLGIEAGHRHGREGRHRWRP